MVTHPEEKRLRHIAFIMDGNGRWAKKRGMPREYGHTEGAKTFRRVAEYCFRNGIEAVTIYAFSTENWTRPEREVKAIMALFQSYLSMGMEEMAKNNIKITFLGDKAPFTPDCRAQMEKLERESASNRYALNVAVNYGGRAEIVTAVNKLIAAGREVTEASISDALYTAGQSDPDLIVRSAGELRLSNFLTWQSVYSELYFTDTLWPDFS
ncbi:MAG: di-trans,poly-cis-decaprenylcistransferase, partial [Oscillospiraceae bacterium]|nr:di-trans,poly-cis-decaprenylcistransferase [Oscillospiraceae bacterium]